MPLSLDRPGIDQTDSADIEEHLKIMHRVYSESMWTAVPLSYTLNDRHLLKSLALYLSDDFPLDGPDRDIDYDPKFHGERLLVRIGQIWTAVMDLKKAGDFLFLIAGDRWFTRTWTYQVKHCATSIYFLVPVDSPLQEVTDQSTTDLVGNDLCLPIDKILARLSHNRIEALLKV